MTALQELKLSGMSILSVPAVLRNVRSPGLVSLIIEPGWNTFKGEVPRDLVDGLSTGTFAIARPHITFVYLYAFGNDEAQKIMCDRYLAAFPAMHREGRLHIVPKPA